MSARQKQLTLHDYRLRSGRGGPRPGAGRPAAKRPPIHHVRRPALAKGCPAHVTLRVREEVPSLRSRRFVSEFRRSLSAACERGEFRVVHFSVQRDHVHMIVEAAGKQALGRGMKSVGARLARAANRVFERSGPVLFGRYHLHVLRTPREVRNAIAYVLLNVRRHVRKRTGSAPPPRLDQASSAPWFDGWKRRSGREAQPKGPRAQPTKSGMHAQSSPVARARTWLLGSGWKRHGLIDPAEVPGGR